MQPSNIGNSGFLLGALLAGFLLWLLVNNRLGTYWNLLIGGGGSSTPATTGSLLNPASPSFNPAQAGQSLGQQFRQWLFGG